jgi:hypothetical protein
MWASFMPTADCTCRMRMQAASRGCKLMLNIDVSLFTRNSTSWCGCRATGLNSVTVSESHVPRSVQHRDQRAPCWCAKAEHVYTWQAYTSRMGARSLSTTSAAGAYVCLLCPKCPLYTKRHARSHCVWSAIWLHHQRTSCSLLDCDSELCLTGPMPWPDPRLSVLRQRTV